jgi:hypothetical protein
MIKFEDIVKGDEFTKEELANMCLDSMRKGINVIYTSLIDENICVEQAGILWHFRLHANEDKWMAMTKYIAETI